MFTGITISAIVLAVVIILFLVSPVFTVQDVVISGNYQVSENNIRSMLNIGPTTNLILFNTRAARQQLLANLYIGDVTFRRVLPGQLYVEIAERQLSAYVEHMGSYLFLDDSGRVLEIRSYFTKPLPILTGLQFTRFQLGEILDVPDSASFSAVVQYAQLIYLHGLSDIVSHINVSDTSNIRIFIHYIEFNVGNVSSADKKIRIIVEILDAIPNADIFRGIVDVRNPYVQVFARPIQ